MKRRHLLALLLLANFYNVTRGAAPPRRVAIELKRYAFTPAQVNACLGETLIIELVSRDFVHGFSIPELGVRIDAPPGRTTELELPLQRTGSFVTLCDNFCGDGHDGMSGRLIVEECRR